MRERERERAAAEREREAGERRQEKRRERERKKAKSLVPHSLTHSLTHSLSPWFLPGSPLSSLVLSLSLLSLSHSHVPCLSLLSRSPSLIFSLSSPVLGDCEHPSTLSLAPPLSLSLLSFRTLKQEQDDDDDDDGVNVRGAARQAGSTIFDWQTA